MVSHNGIFSLWKLPLVSFAYVKIFWFCFSTVKECFSSYIFCLSFPSQVSTQMSCQVLLGWKKNNERFFFMVVVMSRRELRLAFSLGLMTHLKFECRSVLVNKKGKQKQRYATCNTLFLKSAEIPCEDGI